MLAMILASCGVRKTIIQPSAIIEKEKIITETLRDTTILTEADSSFYFAWLKCINGKVVMSNPSIKPSKNGALKTPSVNLGDDGKISVGCKLESDSLKAVIKDLTIKESHKEVITKVVEVEKELTTIQRWFVMVGKIGTVLIGLVLGYGVFSLQKKFKLF